MVRDFVKKLIGWKKMESGAPTIVRQIEDIKLVVIEARREIQVSAWTPKIAMDLLFRIRDKILEDEM